MTWRFRPEQSPAEPTPGTAALTAALSTGPRTTALAAWLTLTHRATPTQAAGYARSLSTNPALTDGEAHLAARVAARPTPARVEDLTDAARHSRAHGATVHRRIKRNLERFGDVVIASCPADRERHRHQRTPDGWLCGDTVKQDGALIDPRPAN